MMTCVKIDEFLVCRASWWFLVKIILEPRKLSIVSDLALYRGALQRSSSVLEKNISYITYVNTWKFISWSFIFDFNFVYHEVKLRSQDSTKFVNIVAWKQCSSWSQTSYNFGHFAVYVHCDWKLWPCFWFKVYVFLIKHCMVAHSSSWDVQIAASQIAHQHWANAGPM